MAARPTVAQLTGAHRQAQLGIRAQALAGLVDLWRGFDPQDLTTSWARLEQPIVALTQAGYGRSAYLGAAYYTTFRALRGVPGTPTTRLGSGKTAEQLAEWLEIAPRWAGTLSARGLPDVASRTLVIAAGTVGRNVMDGGRDTVAESVDADPDAVGYARATGPNPCAFCAMLASRGPVYKSEASAGEDKEYHPHCACTPQPVYSSSDPWPEGSREFRDMWNDAEDANAFRRAIEG